jgi:hypothetical protein
MAFGHFKIIIPKREHKVFREVVLVGFLSYWGPVRGAVLVLLVHHWEELEL